MTNSADPDQLASSTTDLDLHCLLRQGMSCTAREGLNWSQSFEPALMAQLDMHPTDDQEVVGLIPTGLATVFHGDLIMKYFLRSFSPFC